MNSTASQQVFCPAIRRVRRGHLSDGSSLADVELMRRAQAGCDDCFAELVGRHRAAMFRVARSRLGQRELAEEAVQETFLAAYKGRATFDPQRSLRTWLWTILLNQCRGRLRRRARRPQVQSWSDTVENQSETERDAELPGREPAPWDRLLADEQRARLDGLLARLSPAQADALRLRFFGSLKFQEIADAMGCSLATAKNRVRWGLLRLSDLITHCEAPAAGAAGDDEGGQP